MSSEPVKFVIRTGIRKKKMGRFGDIDVWIVNGKLVRRDYDIDFVLGGHHERYEWIPDGEIWLDDEQGKDELSWTLLHELVELRHMKSGYDYDFAHAKANQRELEWRKRNKQVPKSELLKEATMIKRIIGSKNVEEAYLEKAEVWVKPFTRVRRGKEQSFVNRRKGDMFDKDSKEFHKELFEREDEILEEIRKFMEKLRKETEKEGA